MYNNEVVMEASQRPIFPKRAVITGGMPYGNKNLWSYRKRLYSCGSLLVFADRIGTEMSSLSLVQIATDRLLLYTIGA